MLVAVLSLKRNLKVNEFGTFRWLGVFNMLLLLQCRLPSEELSLLFGIALLDVRGIPRDVGILQLLLLSFHLNDAHFSGTSVDRFNGH